MPITIKTPDEISRLREGGHCLAEILRSVAAAAKPGVSTLELDELAEKLIIAAGGAPSFKNYRPKGERMPYPATLCVSINDEVVHTIPRAETILKDGDVVSLDIGMWWPAFAEASAGEPLKKSLCTDMAITIGIGEIDDDAKRLIAGTEEALKVGIAAARPGTHVGDIGAAVERVLKNYRLGIVNELAGHGVGYEVHEDPLISNYGTSGAGPELRLGMVIAIEPIAVLGNPAITLQPDKWTFKTRDRSRAAHFEHTIAITGGKAEVLTAL